jgi:hypothetical protein
MVNVVIVTHRIASPTCHNNNTRTPLPHIYIKTFTSTLTNPVHLKNVPVGWLNGNVLSRDKLRQRAKIVAVSTQMINCVRYLSILFASKFDSSVHHLSLFLLVIVLSFTHNGCIHLCTRGYFFRFANALSKNIRRKPLIAQPLKPLPRLLITHFAPLLLPDPLLRNVDQPFLHALAHLAAPAHKQLGPIIKQLHDFRAVVPQPVLHVLAPLGCLSVLREGEAQRHCAESFPALQEVRVQQVRGRGVAAVEEEGGGESAARSDLGGALLDEATERGEA